MTDIESTRTVTTTQAAAILGVSRPPVVRFCNEGRLSPDGVAVLHMGEFGDPAAMESALESYARTLTGLGYDARVEALAGSLRGVHVRRGAKEANR